MEVCMEVSAIMNLFRERGRNCLSAYVAIVMAATVVTAGSDPCLKDCVCSGTKDTWRVDCSNLNLTKFPSDIEPLTSSIDISWNGIRELPSDSLSTLLYLQELNLANNHLSSVPGSIFTKLPNLKTLSLAENKIRNVPNNTFKSLTHLVILILRNNLIERIEQQAFEGLASLKVLDINGNRLLELPRAISSLPLLQELTFAGNRIQFLDNTSFQLNKELVLLELSGNPLHSVAKSTFSGLPHLRKLTISDARLLEVFPDLSGTRSLEHLRLDRARISSVPQGLCKMVPMLRSLNLKSNKLTALPNFIGCGQLRLIDLSYNMITSLDGEPFLNQRNLIDLFLSHNQIGLIEENSFKGLTSLQVLDLESNDINDIHPDAFRHFRDLRDLNLGANRFPHLPTKGLHNVRQLKTFNNKELKDFPAAQNFPRASTLALSYAYHCCAFISTAADSPSRSTSSLHETIVWLTKDDIDMAPWNTNITDIWLGYENFSTNFEEFTGEFLKTLGRDYTFPDNLPEYAEEYFEDSKSTHGPQSTTFTHKHAVQCLPEPGPFMPCTDLFGWWSLRCGVWVVFLLALLGNGVVVIVLLVGRSKMDVPRFLVCNLAGADFFMGIYLGMLAVVDASTLGEFKVSAIKWQTSPGCQSAGFLAVLSSELSVFTLSVITLERNYAITHAMHLNKRLSLRHAGYIMFAGWTFACVMATLPLFGVSDYKKFAICLPFETEDIISLSYVVFLILINGVAFLILMGCYLKMYCAIRGSQAWNSNDSRIARRMALLVFTDFICWAPIAFFSLTAVCGLQLISLEEAKVFAIFVLPLNSCANPFLYAIFTKQFKKDCIHICKRIEESRITRGIGRGRHSSNFSNRHTPVTVNIDGVVVPFLAGGCENQQDKSVSSEHQVCSCGITWQPEEYPRRDWKSWVLRHILCQKSKPAYGSAYGQTTLQRNNDRRNQHTSSISSESFSFRSNSWRQVHIPMRLMLRGESKRLWKFQRKASQDSNVSCSRQESSTSTYRMSHSSFSNESSCHRKPCHSPDDAAAASVVPNCEPERRESTVREEKPKLCRQSAVEEGQGPKRCVKVFYSNQECVEDSERRQTKTCAFCGHNSISGTLAICSQAGTDPEKEQENTNETGTGTSCLKHERCLVNGGAPAKLSNRDDENFDKGDVCGPDSPPAVEATTKQLLGSGADAVPCPDASENGDLDSLIDTRGSSSNNYCKFAYPCVAKICKGNQDTGKRSQEAEDTAVVKDHYDRRNCHGQNL